MNNEQAQPSTDTPKVTPPIVITDINQFVAILSAWHATKVSILQHMLTIPEGTKMSVQDGPEVVLTGEMLMGMQAGIELCLMELGDLPFEVIKNDPVAEAVADVDTLVEAL